MTIRQQEINTWIASLFPAMDLSNMQYIVSDASQRKYLRLQDANTSYIIMDTAPNQELHNFIELAQLLHKNKLHVPEILQQNVASGLLLLSDLGANTYQDALEQAKHNKVEQLYMDAITALIKLQQIDIAQSTYAFKHMDEIYIKDRLHVFSHWYLDKHLGMTIDGDMLNMLTKMQQLFVTSFANMPQTLVHADFHCRNLMHTSHQNPGILDFQDAIIGPYTYDLVSLLQDAYITWEEPQVLAWIKTYKDFAVTANIISDITLEEVIWHLDVAGLQRHIKNLGVFARLKHRDNKPSYLAHVPTLLGYIKNTCHKYKELNWLSEFIVEVEQA